MRLFTAACLLASVCSLGCGPSNPATANVTGTVTKAGQPIPGATVSFIPEKGRPATGVTDPSGKFKLSTFGGFDGALPGNHKVAIVLSAAAEPMPGTPEAENYNPGAAPFNEKFTNPDTSELTAVVNESGDNDFTFEVTD